MLPTGVIVQETLLVNDLWKKATPTLPVVGLIASHPARIINSRAESVADDCDWNANIRTGLGFSA